MRKLATLFVLMMTFSMVFAGAASAADVEVAVVDENAQPVDVACPGEIVAVQANASSDGDYIINGTVILTTDPETGLEYVPEAAIMIWNGVPIQNDDPILGGFFEAIGGVGIWNIGFMDPNDFAQLIAPAVVTDIGPITVEADFVDVFEEEPILLDTDSYTFLSVPCPPPVNGATVPMQATGSPLAAAALGLLSIIGGAVYGKLR